MSCCTDRESSEPEPALSPSEHLQLCEITHISCCRSTNKHGSLQGVGSASHNSGAATHGGKWKSLGGLLRSTSPQRPGTYSSKIQSPSEPASVQSPGNQWLRMSPFHISSPFEASGGWREGGGSSWGAVGVTRLALQRRFLPQQTTGQAGALYIHTWTAGMVWNAYRLEGLYNVTPATNQSRKVLQHIIHVPLKSKK